MSELKITDRDKYISKEQKISVIYGQKLDEAPHKHDFIELSYVIEGDAEHFVNGESLMLHQGDVFMLDQGAVHSYHALTPEIKVCNILFLPEFLDHIFTESDNFIELACEIILNKNITSDSAGGGFLYIPKENAAKLISNIECIILEDNEKDDGYLEAMHAYLKLLLIHIFRIRGTGGEKIPHDKKKLIADIITYIREHNSNDFSVAEMSRALFFTPEYISTLFKNYTNQSITKFIQTEKLEKAGKLLLTTEMTVDEVMTAVGYSDKKYFYQIFQNFFGMSPGKYRNKD